MKVILTLFYAVLTVISMTASGAELNGVKAFKDWKSEKVSQVSLKILQTKTTLDLLRKKPNSERLIQQYEKSLAQDNWNLEIANELSVTDYMVLYLASQPSKTRFQQAAALLSPSETAEIMEAYSKSLGILESPRGLSNPASSSPVVGTASATQRR